MLIATAANMCQTLGYHRDSTRHHDEALRTAQERLFWNVYRIDKGFSLRLGRPSIIRDSDVTLSTDLSESRNTRLARLQGKAYDNLYSPAGLSQSDGERHIIAMQIAQEIRNINEEIRCKIQVCGS